MRKITLVLIFCTIISQIWAQTKQIKGKVTDENGLPLQGVSVTGKSGIKGTQTDETGAFTVAVPSNTKLQLGIG